MEYNSFQHACDGKYYILEIMCTTVVLKTKSNVPLLTIILHHVFVQFLIRP